MSDTVFSGHLEYSVTENDDVEQNLKSCNLTISAWLNGRSETVTLCSCGPSDKICFMVENLIYSGIDQNQVQDIIEDFID